MAAGTASIPVLPVAARSARVRTTGLIMAVASALAFSSSGPLIKPLLEAGWSLGAALLVRMGVAGLILSAPLVLAIRRQPGFLRRHGLLILGFGLTAVAGCQIFFFGAMQRMPVAIALLIQYLAPVLLVGLRVGAHPPRALAPRDRRLHRRRHGTRARGRHRRSAVRPARHGAGPGRGRVRGGLLPDLRARGRRPAAARPRRRGTAGGRRLHGRCSCVSGILPFAAPAVSVLLAGMELPWFVPLLWVAAIATTRRLRPRRHGRAARRARASRRSSGSPRCSSRSASPGCCSARRLPACSSSGER